jgi:hypothetical protein
MMKIKLKETRPTKLTKAPDVLIMNQGVAPIDERFVNESALEGRRYLRKERNDESERGRHQHPQ